MAIHVALHHRTHYQYDRPVSLGPQTVRLRPAPHCRTRILRYSLKIEPEEHFLHWQQDPQANFVARIVMPKQTREFLIEVDLVAEMAVQNPFDFFLEPAAERFPFAYDAELDDELELYRRRLPGTVRLAAYTGELRRALVDGNGGGGAGTVDFLVELNRRLHDDVRYLLRLESGLQTPEETLEKGSGSCRDSAWLLCQLLREFGLASRFVSGYLIQLTSDGEALGAAGGAAHDFTALHAWCEVYLPGAGWIGLDPTSGLLAGEGHIPLAATADPHRAAPITGTVEACHATFHHEMTVTRIFESSPVAST